MLDFLIQKAHAEPLLGGEVGGTKPYIGGEIPALENLLTKILDNIVNPIILLLMALSVVYFLWGMFEFIQNAESSDGRQQGYRNMGYGIAGIFIMVSAFGIKNIIASTLGL